MNKSTKGQNRTLNYQDDSERTEGVSDLSATKDRGYLDGSEATNEDNTGDTIDISKTEKTEYLDTTKPTGEDRTNYVDEKQLKKHEPNKPYRITIKAQIINT